MRLRPVALVTASAILLAGGFTACRADPSVAAYVDGVRITEAEVDEVIDGPRQIMLAEIGPDPDPTVLAQVEARLATLREGVVQIRVITEAGYRYAEAQGVEVPPPDPASYAAEVGLAADHPYAAVVAEYQAVLGALRDTVAPVAPSEADQREIYDSLVAAGVLAEPFEAIQDQLTMDLVGDVVAERDLIHALVAGVDIHLNPRYELVYRVPLQVAGSEVGVLGVPLTDAAVVDAG